MNNCNNWPYINLPTTDTLSNGMMLPVFSRPSQIYALTTIQTLSDQIEENVAASLGQDSFQLNYSSPSATGFTASVTDNTSNQWLILTPVATYANGTIVLPTIGASDATDHQNQEILVNCTQIVTTLAITAPGATVVGAPTTLAANGFFRLKFEPIMKRWYRVG